MNCQCEMICTLVIGLACVVFGCTSVVYNTNLFDVYYLKFRKDGGRPGQKRNEMYDFWNISVIVGLHRL